MKFLSKLKVLFLIIFLNILHFNILSEGFSADTLVLSPLFPNDYVLIDSIKTHDQVICYDFDAINKLSSNNVNYISRICAKRHLKINVESNFVSRSLYTTFTQRFYDVTSKSWVQAMYLLPDQILLSASKYPVVVKNVEIINEPKTFYRLSVDEHHNFFVTDLNICVHNFVPITVGIRWVFGGGAKLTFDCVKLAIGCLLAKNKNEKKKPKEVLENKNFNIGPNSPDPDEDKSKKERKVNLKEKQDCFKNSLIKDNYVSSGKSRILKPGGTPLDKNVYRISWDKTHKDFEAYDKRGKHLGSIDPETNKFYKLPIIGRIFES